MNSVKRNGVDIDKAFALASRRLHVKSSIKKPATEDELDVSYAGLSLIVRHTIKLTLRRAVLIGMRLVRPVTRPLMFRLRSYFTADIHREMMEEFSKMQRAQHQHHQQIVIELERLANAAKVQTRLSQRVFSSQISREDVQQQLDRIEQYSLTDANRVAIDSAPGEILVKTAVGYVLCAAKDYALLAALLQTGELEPGTRLLIERLIKPGDVFIDVGANIGLHSIAAARAMGGEGKIIAFEPFEPTRSLLEKNLWLNGFSTISETSQLALSDKSEKRKLHLGATSGHHSLYKLDELTSSPVASVDVSTIALDDFLPENQLVTMLKIDAEGAEIDVIKGARKLLDANPHMLLIVELGQSHLHRTNVSLEEWLAHFTNRGLAYNVINAETGELENWTLEQLSKTPSVNLLFSSPESLHAPGTNA